MPHDPWDVGPKVAPSKAPVAKVKTSRPAQPEAKAAGPRTKPSYTGPEAHSGLLYGQPGYSPVAPGAPRHKVAPAPPSAADVQFGNIVKAIGPDVVKKASNPRVAGLQSVLGDVTGIPSIVNAATSGHHLAGAAVSAASLFPVGRFGRAAELLAKLGRGGKAAEDVAKVAAPVAREARPVVAPAAKAAAPSPRVFKVTRDEVTGTSNPVGALNDYHRLMPKNGEHLYHSTSADQFAKIRKEGLKPGRERKGEVTGVYFAEDGIGLHTLRPANARAGDVILRARRADVPTETTDMFEPGSGFAEHVSRNAVPPQHLEYLGHDNQWHPVAPPGSAPQVRHVPMTPEQATARLAKLDKQHEQLLKKIAPEVNPYAKGEKGIAGREPDATSSSAETRGRNTMRGRMDAGKKPATGKAIEGRVGGGTGRIKTIQQEVHDLAETKLHETIAKYPNEPAVQKIAAMIAEREQLRAALNAHAEAAFAGHPPPELPTHAVPVPGAAPMLPQERPGVLPHWNPQGQLFPRPDSPGRFATAPREPGTLFPGEAKPTIEGTPLSPQGEVFQAHQPVTPRDIARATPQYGATPKLRPGMETPGTGGQMGRIIREQLPLQKSERVLMDKSFSMERGQRFTAFNQKLQQNPTLEGFHSAMGELKGELQKRHLPGLTELDTNALVNHVAFRPGMLPGQKVQALKAVEKMLEGQIIQPSERVLLENVFGRVVTGHLSEISKLRRLKGRALDAVNIPRSIMASLDVSAPFRQGLVVGLTHPVIFSKNIGPMFKALISQATYDDYLEAIHASPNWHRMEGRVAFTEVGRDLSQREEQFVSHMAETITGLGIKDGKYSFVKASGRAYTGFLDKVRADLFDELHAKALRLNPDKNPDDPKFLDDLARLVNDMTGRGQLPGGLKNHAVTLNTLFFSPRLLMSRINLLLSPALYARADPFVRREALKTVAEAGAVLTTILTFAAWAGAKVVTDPRSADFAKLKFGNTRIDIGGGFQQVIRQAWQQATQSTVNAAGKTIHFGAEGPGKVTSWGTFFRFIRSKAAPVPSLLVDLQQRQTFGGQPLTAGQAAYSRLVPLGLQDAITTGQVSHSIPAGLGAFGASAVGIGVQSYKPRQKKGGGVADPWGVGGGSSPDPWGVSP